MHHDWLIFAFGAIPLIAMLAVLLDTASSHSERFPRLLRNRHIILAIEILCTGLTALMVIGVIASIVFFGLAPAPDRTTV